MKQILLLSNMYPSKVSPGHGVFVKNIETMLVTSGLDIRRAVIYGRQTGVLAKLWAYFVFIITGFFSILFSNRIVYVHYLAHSSLPLLLASLFKKLHIIAHAHGGDTLPAMHEPPKVRRIKMWLARKTLAKASLVIVPSYWYKQHIVKTYQVDPAIIQVSPSGGVNTSNFKADDNKTRNGQFTNHHQPIKLGYVGRLDKGKGVQTLLLALAELSVPFECEIVGTGTEEQKYRQMAQQLNIDDRVSFYGVLPQPELITHYQRFDFLVFPSELDESLGLVGLEAMACSVPLIASMRGGMRDYQTEGDNTIRFISGDVQSLVDAVNQASGLSLEAYETMRDNARRKALEFDAQLCNEGLLKLLESA